MLQWNDLHPYNAVHVVRIPGVLDGERLRSGINGTLETYGVTGLSLDRDKGTYQYHGGPVGDAITVLPVGGVARLSLVTEVERQLNTAFACGERFDPFRFFVAPEEDCFSLGLVYFHAIADAESVVFLMKDIINAYTRSTGSGAFTPVDLYPGSPRSLLRHRPFLFAKKLSAFAGLVASMRKSSRPRYRDAQNLNNEFALFSLDPANLVSLIETGRSWNVSLNDLFLALLLKSVADLASGRKQASRRRKISVGSIVNLRKDLGLDGRETFGLFLGSFFVSHEVPDGINLRDLARDIRRRTRAIKQARMSLRPSWDLALTRFIYSLYSTEQRKKFYQKHCPLWGGITNMNLNSLWQPADGAQPPDYFRAVSTGPAIPLVLSVTTIRDFVNMGLTYRTTVFSAAEIEQVQRRLLDTIRHPEGQA